MSFHAYVSLGLPYVTADLTNISVYGERTLDGNILQLKERQNLDTNT
jgi:hypothetical protein